MKESSHGGRGVFTSDIIQNKDIIEICPVIKLSAKDTEILNSTILHDYYFIWDLANKTSAIALGYGSIYNHSENPNAEFEINQSSQEIRYQAIKDIPMHDEITINYIGLVHDNIKLWFDPH